LGTIKNFIAFDGNQPRNVKVNPYLQTSSSLPKPKTNIYQAH